MQQGLDGDEFILWILQARFPTLVVHVRREGKHGFMIPETQAALKRINQDIAIHSARESGSACSFQGQIIALREVWINCLRKMKSAIS